MREILPTAFQERPIRESVAGFRDSQGWTSLPLAAIFRATSRTPPAAATAAMKQFWTQFFTWWNGQTLGTRYFTWRKGQFVGEDEFGNRYYRYTQANPIDSNVGAERRWVVYNGYADASKVPPGWRAWLCHNGDLAPSEETYKAHAWEKPFLPNLTGTTQAYRPQGSVLASGQRPSATGDYVPWTPGE